MSTATETSSKKPGGSYVEYKPISREELHCKFAGYIYKEDFNHIGYLYNPYHMYTDSIRYQYVEYINEGLKNKH